MNNLIYFVHAFTCFFMTGLIWLIQQIHYPAYRFISAERFAEYQRFHTSSITFIVGPIMAIELLSGFSILFYEKFNAWSTLNFLGLILIWLTTAFLSVPSHAKLSMGFSQDSISFLISTNWIRTILWTVRSFLLLYLLNRTFIQTPPL